MRKYLYFRDVADENDDDDISASIAIPVDSIRGVVPVAITTLELYYNKEGKAFNDKVTLTVTRGKLQEVMQELCGYMNNTSWHSGLTVVADAATTTVNASSIEGNDVTKAAKYFSNDVTAVAIAAGQY